MPNDRRPLLSYQVTNVERLFEDPTKVDVMFYVIKAGVPMSSRDSLEVFSQLSDVEASALLTYPVNKRISILECNHTKRGFRFEESR